VSVAEPPTPPGEIFRALAVFAEPPGAEHGPLAATLGLGAPPTRAEHTDVFGFRFFPYASVYLGPEGMRGGEAGDRIAGFWRALELEPPADPDHLTVLLAAYGALLDRAAAARESEAESWRHASQVFLHEHLLSWAPLYLARLEADGGGFYGTWARRLRRLLVGEPLAERLAATLPAALREAPPLPDPRVDGGEAFLHALLVPARVGFLLTRDDLARLAGELGLGRRVGERRFVLRGLMSQDAAAVLRALAGRARAGAALAAACGLPPSARDWWRGRAAAAGELLASLAADATAREPAGDSAAD